MDTQTKHTHGYIAVARATAGNTFITILKFIGFFISGSGALFSEAIHSVVDTLNQVLLMIGIKKSSKKADENFSYGYGKERFFRAIISACGIFFIGAGVTVYHGIEALIHLQHIEHSVYVYIILITAFIVEGLTLYIAIKSIYNKKLGFIESIKLSDNATKAVILEDSVAVFGVFIAFGSILLANLTGKAYFDAIGSIIIGLLLAVIAIILIIENKSFLLGKSIDEEVKEEIIELISANPIIEKITDFRSEVIDIDSYIIKVDAEFNGSSLMREINKNGFLADEYDYFKDDYNEFLRFCVDYADRVPRLIGNEINKIEKEIHLKYPEVKHIDIEMN